jgi:hypothetical protein
LSAAQLLRHHANWARPLARSTGIVGRGVAAELKLEVCDHDMGERQFQHSGAAQSLDHGMVEAIDEPIAECDPEQFLKRLFWPLGIRNSARSLEYFISAERHVGFEANPFPHRQFGRFRR